MTLSSGFRILLCLAAVASARPAVAAPKNLSAARSAYEQADKELNSLYGDVRASLRKEALGKFRDEQGKWLEYRDYLAERRASRGEDNPAGADPRDTLSFWQTRHALTKVRLDYLRAVLGKGIPVGIAGHYEDSYGGRLDLFLENAQLFFRFEVTRGLVSQTGTLAGSAKLSDATAEFSDGGKGHEDHQPATLRFAFAKPGLEVTGQNTQLYHGSRAYFDGHYVKYRGLEADEIAKLRKAAAAGPVAQ